MLSHTISGAVVADVRCNGRSLGEIGLNAALAAHMGAVPVLAVGDDTVAIEAADVVPGIHSVVVKHALGWSAARRLHPDEACRRIEAAVGPALDARSDMHPLRFDGAVRVEVDVFEPRQLDNALARARDLARPARARSPTTPPTSWRAVPDGPARGAAGENLTSS